MGRGRDRKKRTYLNGLATRERFWAKVTGVGSFTACWIFGDGTGYGTFSPDTGVIVKAHRYAYETLIGEIPEGLHLDHLCRQPACVNPWHLDPVTPAVNTHRGQGHGSETHCPQGHPYDDENTYRLQGRRYCRTCRKARSKARSESRVGASA